LSITWAGFWWHNVAKACRDLVPKACLASDASKSAIRTFNLFAVNQDRERIAIVDRDDGAGEIGKRRRAPEQQ
jgi:hypothetical protein